MNYDDIGKFIANLRKEKNLTQKDLALKIGVTDKAVSKWERGKGCPDVSILDELSSVLGVSILEILKGKRIDEKTINEVNDYVLDTINYSKKEINDKYKNLILNIISTLIIVIIGFIFILNIYHINYLNKKESYKLDSTEISKIDSNLEKIYNNINIIENSKTIFTKQENEELLNILKNNYDRLKEHPLFKYKEGASFSINDLYVIGETSFNSNLIDGYKILKFYDESKIDNMYNYSIFDFPTRVLLFNTLNKGYNSYKYSINNKDYIAFYSTLDAYLGIMLKATDNLLIFSNDVIEVGVK